MEQGTTTYCQCDRLIVGRDKVDDSNLHQKQLLYAIWYVKSIYLTESPNV